MRDCHALSIPKLSIAAIWCLGGASDKRTDLGKILRSWGRAIKSQCRWDYKKKILTALAEQGRGLTTVTTNKKKWVLLEAARHHATAA